MNKMNKMLCLVCGSIYMTLWYIWAFSVNVYKVYRGMVDTVKIMWLFWFYYWANKNDSIYDTAGSH